MAQQNPAQGCKNQMKVDIRIYTKTRHTEKIQKFLTSKKISHEIHTIKNEPSFNDFDLGVSYCYPRKIQQQLLTAPRFGFINYHPAPLPKYKGNTELTDAIKDKQIHWGVTVHKMNEEYDDGKIIHILKFDLHEPPTSTQELGAISHYFLFKLFKNTVAKILYDSQTSKSK
jgi:methionyl-tRNA formyltransferase